MPDAERWSPQENTAQACLSSLQAGLLLEDRPLFIPWKAKITQIRGDYPPDEIVKAQGWEELYWRNTILLAGLAAPLVQVILYPHGWLDSACAVLEKSSDEFRIQRAFERAQAHLTALLGPAGRTCASGGCEQAHALAAWDWPQLNLALAWRLSEPFQPYASQVCLHIAHR